MERRFQENSSPIIFFPTFISLKKIIAILLLAIYLFNLAGYSFLFGYFIRQSDHSFVQQLDQNEYNDAELYTISIPLHTPYIQNSGGFERVDGSVEYKGVQYNYVKRMVQNDTLYIKVMANRQKTQLVNEQSSFAGAVNDFATGKKDKEPVAKKWNCTSEYNNCIARYTLAISQIPNPLRGYGLRVPLQSVYIDMPGHPPRPAFQQNLSPATL